MKKIRILAPRIAMLDTRRAAVLEEPSRQHTREHHTGSRAWLRLRMQTLVRDGYTCQLCGVMDKSNEVDHIDGDAWNNDPSNLRTLCKSCHSTHGKEGNSKPRESKYTIA